MAKRVNAQQAAAGWDAAMRSGATREKYKRGIEQLQENPMEKAAARADFWQERVAASKQRFADKLRAVSFAQYKTNAMTTGAERLSSGATKALPKVQAHFQRWGPIYEQASAAAESVAKTGTLGNALERVSKALEVMMAAAGRT